MEFLDPLIALAIAAPFIFIFVLRMVTKKLEKVGW